MTGDGKSDQVSPTDVNYALSRDVIIQNYSALVARHAELIRQQEKLIDNLTRLLSITLAPRLVRDHQALGAEVWLSDCLRRWEERGLI